MMKIPYQN